MLVVFCLSTELGSSANTGAILGPLLRWFDPTISEAALEHAHFLVRKGAHVTEYAILALLILRALRILRDVPAGRWSWRLAAAALAISAVYAATDEAHQLLVPTRGPSIHDVIIDAVGATIGLMLAFWRTPTDASRPDFSRP
jgi:VanZ family protein